MIETAIFYIIMGGGATACLISIKKWMDSINYNNYNSSLYTTVNVILSQVSSVNNQITDLSKFNIVRLYLIKSYRGRAHAIGKPVKGQRT